MPTKTLWDWQAHPFLQMQWENRDTFNVCLFEFNLLLIIFQTPHPLYRPSNDFVPCRDPLCASLQPTEDYNCEHPDQCDYEINYADQYSTYGVLLNDVYLLNSSNGVQLKVRMALGLVYSPSFASAPLNHFYFIYLWMFSWCLDISASFLLEKGLEIKYSAKLFMRLNCNCN